MDTLYTRNSIRRLEIELIKNTVGRRLMLFYATLISIIAVYRKACPIFESLPETIYDSSPQSSPPDEE